MEIGRKVKYVGKDILRVPPRHRYKVSETQAAHARDKQTYRVKIKSVETEQEYWVWSDEIEPTGGIELIALGAGAL